MYQAIAHFHYQHFESDPVLLINQIVEQWRNNGQIIGREIGITHHQMDDHFEFHVKLALPEQDSLLEKWQNAWVDSAFEQAEQAGISFKFFEIVGRDYNAEQTADVCNAPFQLLYTTHLESCSPVYHGKDFCPIPLYRLGISAELSRAIIQWQENWQACDQLQMNGNALEAQALAEISEVDSPLSRQGRALCRRLERKSGIPTFYYLYRLGSDSQTEYHRHCPICHQPWKLPEPLHEIFHFKCENCRLISNLSWELMG